jgi:hypothetical protein
MPRYVIIDPTADRILNIINYDEPLAGEPPGFPPGTRAIEHEQAGMDWSYDGTNLNPPAPPALPPEPPEQQAERARIQSYKDDPDTVDIADRIRNAAPAQIDNWLSNHIADVPTRKMLAAIIKLIVSRQGYLR